MSVTLRPPATEPSDAIRRTVWSGWRLTAIITSAAALVGAIALATLAHPPTPSVEVGDTAGRIGFVVLLAAALGLVWWLDTRARRPVVPDADVFVPLRLIVGLFATLAATWTVYSNLVLDAFSRGRFGYLEWLTQMMNLVAARGMWNVWTPYPQGTQELLVALQSLAAMLAGVLNSDIWTGFTLFRLAFELAFLVGPAVAMVWLVGATGKTFGRSAQTIGTLTMALSFGIVYYGAASAYVTDPLPAALGIAAILAVVRKKFNWAGAAIGLGASLKLFPILLLPALVVLLPATGWHVNGMLVLARPRANMIQQMPDGLFLSLNSTVLGGSHDKVGLSRAAAAQEGQHVSRAISHMHRAVRRRQAGRSARPSASTHPFLGVLGGDADSAARWQV